MSDFNAQVIEEFRANDGQVGGMFEGSKLIVITVKGAKSGKLYEIPLVYAPDGDKFLIIGSYGGSDVHPAWYRNILANPRFKVEVGKEHLRWMRATWKATSDGGDSKFWRPRTPGLSRLSGEDQPRHSRHRAHARRVTCNVARLKNH